MTLSKREWIYVGGALGAWLILKPKTPGKPGVLSKLTSALIPKVTPRPTTTNLATGYGTRTVPVGPSSGIGFNPTTAARATTLTPVTAGITVGGGILQSLIGKLFTPAAPAKPGTSSSSSPQKPAQGSPSGNTSGPTGGQKSTGAPGAPSNGGMIADQPTPDGFYASSGTWVATDPDGNILPNPDGTLPGYYDTNPASASYGDYIEGTVLDSTGGGGGLQASIPNLAGQDFSTPNSGENDQALEVVDYADPAVADNSTIDWSQVGTVAPVDDGNADTISDPGTGYIFADDSGGGASGTDSYDYAPDDGLNGGGE